jgi:hypothetical protein
VKLQRKIEKSRNDHSVEKVQRQLEKRFRVRYVLDT